MRSIMDNSFDELPNTILTSYGELRSNIATYPTRHVLNAKYIPFYKRVKNLVDRATVTDIPDLSEIGNPRALEKVLSVYEAFKVAYQIDVYDFAVSIQKDSASVNVAPYTIPPNGEQSKNMDELLEKFRTKVQTVELKWHDGCFQNLDIPKTVNIIRAEQQRRRF